MEYWAGSPPPLYAKCGTVPGRNFAHAYQDKHRAADVHPYICERQDQGREPSCWTVPGSRTGGVLQDYTNWTDQDLSAPHFPFALESQAQQLQGLRDYQAQERREREWLVGEVHRAAARDRERDRESERRRQREGWQARWEPWSPVHYRREPAKRSLSNSSYRELEAWAARYSHSLPRKRRLEAGLWGVAHGSQDTDRLPERVPWGHRGGAEPRTGAAHLTGVPCQPREWGRWERRDTQPAVSHRGSQLVTPDKTYPSDTKENESRYQKRGFSQPPGYIPPPPYNTPHSISPATQRDEKYTAKEAMASAYATWDWGASRHTYSTLPTPRKKDYSVLDFPRERGGAGEFINEEWKQRTWSDPGGHRQTGRAVTGQWTGSSAHPQNTPVQSHSLSPPQQCLEQPQAVALSETDSHSTNTEREVSLKKRRGRETIFCLVSRMGGVAGLSSSPEEPHKPLSLPLFTTSPLTAVSNSELGRASQNVEEPDASKDSPELADEVDSAVQFLQPDSRVTTQTPASVRNCNNKPNLKGALEWKGSEQIAAHREELLRAIRRRPKLQGEETDIHRLPNTTDSEVVLPEGTSVKALSPVSRRKEMQTLAPVSAKYPLWREPSSTGRVKSENPSPSYLTCEGELIKNLDNDCTENRHDVRTHPHNVEVRQLELKRDTESDSSSGLLVIDATCVVVRVEFIFPPKIEHVQYLCSPTPSEQTEPDPSPPINPMETDKEIQDDTTPTPDQTIDKSAPICSLLDMKESVTSFEELYLQEKVDEEHHISSHTSVSETDIPQQSEETNQLAESLSSSTSVPESETLEERAERILGIPFQSSCVLDKTENNEMKQLTKDEKDEDTPEEQVSEPSPETEEDVSVIDSDVLSYDQSSTDMLEESKMEQRGQICDVSVENSSNCLLDVKVMPDRDSENKLPFDPWHEAGQFGDVFFPPISCCPNLPLSFSNPPSHSSTDAVSLNNSRPSSPSHLLLTSPSQFISLSPHPGTESSSLSDEFPLYPSDGNVPVFPASCTPELSDSLSRLPSPPPSHSAHPSSSSTPPPSGPHSPSSSPPPSTSVPPSTSSTPSPSVPHSPSSSTPLSSSSSPPPSVSLSPSSSLHPSVSLTPSSSPPPPPVPHSSSSSPPSPSVSLSPSCSPPPPPPPSVPHSPCSSPPPSSSVQHPTSSSPAPPPSVPFSPSSSPPPSPVPHSTSSLPPLSSLVQHPTSTSPSHTPLVPLSPSSSPPPPSVPLSPSSSPPPPSVPLSPSSSPPPPSVPLSPSSFPHPTPSVSLSSSSSPSPPPSFPFSPSNSPSPSNQLSSSDSPPTLSLVPLSSCSSPPPPPSIPHSRSSSPPPYTAQLSPSISPPPPIHLSPSSSPPPTHSLSPSRSPPLPDPSSRAKSPEIVGKAFTPVLSAFTTPTTYIEEPRYPKALWDAVKCIRKHTAPDSENEEEGCEPWGPESVASDDAALDDLDLGLGEMSQRREENVSSSRGSPLEVAEDMEAERDLDMLVTSTRGERSSEKEPSGPAEDDTLSCSSTDSHGSGDTVIMGADGESEEETETEEETDYEADIISEEEEPNPNIGHCVTAGQEWSCTVGPKRYVVVEGQDEGDRELRSTAEPQNEGSWSEIQATTQQVEGTVECEKSDGVRNLEGTENRGLFGVMASEEAGGGMGDHHLNHP